MAIWKLNTTNDITVIHPENLSLDAYYVPEGGDSYISLNETWVHTDDRYVCDYSFSQVGTYILKIIDISDNMPDIIEKIEVKEFLQDELVENIATDVWDVPTRSLTDNDVNVVSVDNVLVTLEDFQSNLDASDIWNYANRTVQSENELSAADVWNYIGRSLDTEVDATIKHVNFDVVSGLDDFKATISEVDLSGIAEDVWTYATRNISNPNTIDASAVWNYATRELTNNTANITQVNGTNVILEDFQATVDVDLSSIPSDVWNYTNRALTYYNNDVNINDFKSDLSVITTKIDSVPNDVWNYTDREITNENTISPSDIWNYSTRDLTDNSANITEVNGALISIDDFKYVPDYTAISNSVWDNTTKEITNGISANDVWNHSTRDLTDNSSNITEVNGLPVNIDDFKADVSGITATVDVQSIVNGILDEDINNHLLSDTIGAMIHNSAFTESKVFIDTELITNGDGTQIKPFNNFDDGKNLAESNNIYVLSVHGDSVVPSNFKNFSLTGIGLPVIETNNQDLSDSKFTNVKLSGDYISTIIAQDSVLLDGLTLNGFFEKCVITGELISKLDSRTLLANCISGLMPGNAPTINMNTAGASRVKVSNYSGDLSITQCNHIDDFMSIEITGDLTIDSSCTNGTIIVKGICTIIDNSNGTTIIDKTINQSTVYDTNIIKVNDNNILIDDFKADLSNLPSEVWAHAARTLTQDIGLTALQDAQFLDILNNTTDIDLQVWNSGSKDITSDVKFVNGVAINIDDFKADLSATNSELTSIKNTVNLLENYDDTNITDLINQIKSLEPDERAKLLSLENYDDTVLVSKVDNKPSLLDIENSTILAKEQSISTVEAIVQSLPQLQEIRAEMINVQFGGLEISENQMIITDVQGTTIAIFDLYDNQGNPTMNAVYKRVNV